MPQNVESVCIIDDDQIYVNLVSKVIALRQLSKKVINFENGKEALKFFKKTVQSKDTKDPLPKIVLLDLNMPIMDGWEFLNEYLQIKDSIPQDLRIYVVSSSINPRDVERAKAIEEVSDYIVKPIRVHDFERIFSNQTI